MKSEGQSSAASGKSWGEQDLKRFEARLLEERKRAVEQMKSFDHMFKDSQEAAEGEITTWRFHMADEGSDSFEREQNYLLASREGRLLWHIDEALRRLYRTPEQFGICEECGKRISKERLDAIPYVARCIDCKQDWEGGQPS